MGEASSTRLRVSWPWPTRKSSRQIQPWGYKSGKRANATVELQGTLMCFPKSIYTISLIHFWTCCLHNHLWQPFPEGQYWLCKVLPFFKPSTRCNDSPLILDLVNKNSTFILLPLKFWKPTVSFLCPTSHLLCKLRSFSLLSPFMGQLHYPLNRH